MNIDEMLAREAIRYTMAIYNNEGDRGRLEGLASAFMPDGVLETGADEPYVGRDAIIAGLSAGVQSRRATGADKGFKPLVRHHLTTSRIDMVSPSEATSFTYFFVVTNAGPDHNGTYADRWTKSGDRWLLAHRKVSINWNSPNSTMVLADEN